MNKALLLVLFLLIFVSCKQNISAKNLVKINGYWQIQYVIQKDGQKKDYKMSETEDYFELKKNIGFRQKVMPQFDGTYQTNGVPEKIKITNNDNNDFFINYTTKYQKWKEQIVEIQDSILVLKSNDKIEYHYKKTIPFSIK